MRSSGGELPTNPEVARTFDALLRTAPARRIEAAAGYLDIASGLHQAKREQALADRLKIKPVAPVRK